ncbi:unnamed protein product [Notodromas monacha]|uniref:Integrin alpha third immunoglobulin-like domain-containing protein n=1 Tax=Notodromas monacha TaxID=399045 RepID=A0A7R9GB94_9CRUS|nr:unnamed protein product [Notodromas monacha]CAG0916111.1 unnamed protein product [Notodromas monacha]
MRLMLFAASFFLAIQRLTAEEWIDVKTPVHKMGPRGSYFGFSLAQHVYHEGSKRPAVVLVGAPIAEDEKQRLYVCPANTRDANDCFSILDASGGGGGFGGSGGSSSGGFGGSGGSSSSNGAQQAGGAGPHDGGSFFGDDDAPAIVRDPGLSDWMGVTVESGGLDSPVLACAHRSLLADGKHAFGSCQVFSADLLTMTKKDLESCSGLSQTSKLTDGFDLCQSGISAHVTTDKDAFIGAPGSIAWRGSVSSSNLTSAFPSGHLLNRTAITSSISSYSYFGYSVTSGTFVVRGDPRRAYFAVGAPRGSEGRGEVRLVRKTSREPWMDILTGTNLTGEHIASYFGSSVAAADVNGDGLDDLIVGSPYFHDHDYKRGGAVYVYLNTNASRPEQAFIDSPTYKRSLYGSSKSKFGFAVESIGDLNHDGADDILVGAPGAQGGKVYLFFGKPGATSAHDIFPTRTGDQIISAKTLNSSFGGTTDADNHHDKKHLLHLGTSISAGMDLNADGSPDVAVASYTTDSILILAAHPILTVVLHQEIPDDLLNPERAKYHLEVGLALETCGVCRDAGIPESLDDFSTEKAISRARLFAGIGYYLADHTYPLSSDEPLILRARLQREQDPAYQAKFRLQSASRIRLIEAMQVIGPHSDDVGGSNSTDTRKLKCASRSSRLDILCELEPVMRQQTTEIEIRLSVDLPATSQHLLNFKGTFSASTASTDAVAEVKNIRAMFKSDVVMESSSDPSTVKLSAFPAVRGDGQYQYFDEAGLSVTHSYLFSNEGPSRIPLAKVKFEWPDAEEMGDDKKDWILYLKSEPRLTTKTARSQLLNAELKDARKIMSIDQFSVGLYCANLLMTMHKKICRGPDENGATSYSCYFCDLVDWPVHLAVSFELDFLLWSESVKPRVLSGDGTKWASDALVEWPVTAFSSKRVLKKQAVTGITADQARETEKVFPLKWIIGGSIVGGLVLLAGIILCLRCCGFFDNKTMRRAPRINPGPGGDGALRSDETDLVAEEGQPLSPSAAATD